MGGNTASEFAKLGSNATLSKGGTGVLGGAKRSNGSLFDALGNNPYGISFGGGGGAAGGGAAGSGGSGGSFMNRDPFELLLQYITPMQIPTPEDSEPGESKERLTRAMQKKRGRENRRDAVFNRFGGY